MSILYAILAVAGGLVALRLLAAWGRRLDEAMEEEGSCGFSDLDS